MCLTWVSRISHVIITCDCTCAFSVRDEFIALLIVCLHRKLSHNKLVQLYGVVTQRSPIYLVFEFMENGCLTDFLRARKGSFSQEVLLEMCLDVSEGMAYLETSNFIHRDLVSVNRVFKVSISWFWGAVCSKILLFKQAARNCLVSEDNVVKISDFGMTRWVAAPRYCGFPRHCFLRPQRNGKFPPVSAGLS